ncbi:MAG: PTS system mannose/fructose/sorbose family transporter subunit IID [Nitrospiraceae bacterium]|nr:PTS system mannose/fructose/sorbose family transporter subunit IID [Nitrospiraceae bacterium]
MAEHKHRTVRRADLLGMFWRSFFIQASWSYDRMQSLGFSFAMIPALRRLYPDPEEFAERLRFHMDYFNTQPYFASFILGAAAKLEEERAAGRKTDADIAEVKKTLMAPLGALGDSFCWGALKPLAASVAVAALLVGAGWAPLLFLALYNIGHVALRAGLIVSGYGTGGDVVALISRYNFTQLARLFKVLSLSVIGCIAGMTAVWEPSFRPAGSLPGPLLSAGAFVITLGLGALLRMGASPVKLMFGLAALCLGLALGGMI